MPTIETVTGPVDSDSVGLTLPHEHVFVDLLRPQDPGFCQVDLGTDTRRRLTHENPARAIARPTGG